MRRTTRTMRGALPWLLLCAVLPASSCLDEGTPAPGTGTGCKTAADCKNNLAGICDAISHTCRACQGPMDDAACQTRNPTTPRCGVSGTCIAQCSGAGQVADCKD